MESDIPGARATGGCNLPDVSAGSNKRATHTCNCWDVFQANHSVLYICLESQKFVFFDWLMLLHCVNTLLLVNQTLLMGIRTISSLQVDKYKMYIRIKINIITNRN